LTSSGLAALLYGLDPRLVALTWAVLGYAFVTGVFGTRFIPLLILLGTAAVGAGIGSLAVRRRGINVT
jgi:putative exporter of polyketide antibiotics